VDQEGGPVRRIRTGIPTMPSAREVAETSTPEDAELLARRVGASLRDLGINTNLAPVLDVVGDRESFLYERSYGADAKTVSRFGRATIEGYAAAGVITSAKHFPGHGSARGDTHTTLARSTLSGEALEEHLAPFREAVGWGVPSIMVSHVVVDALDPARPASLSPAVITDLLRRQLGFRGVALSDDLQMLQVAQGMPLSESAVQALRAGLDLLIVSAQGESPLAARDAIVEAVRQGELPGGRLDEAVLRVLRLKEEFGLLGG
jgi:beta-N-acetylhexosaminidase